ncbi:MAG: glucose-1-phosphatase [Bacteroidales bacterium]|nr:glucose-1-phosphatase [Bacteroidales bacterium]
MSKRLSVLAVAVLLLAACSPRLTTGRQGVPEAFQPRPAGFSDRYAREELVILSRHNIRSPISGPGSVLSRITPHEWFAWSSAPGELSLRGGALEMEMGQFFREWLVGEGFFDKNAVPEKGTVRFYANSIQRTRATARAFAAGMFPMADIDVEQHAPLGTMDPVFNPQITRLSEGFLAKAYAEIQAMGGTDAPVKAKYALLEKVLDIQASPAARNDTTSFGWFPSSVHFEMGKEPIMTGGLKMACSASDALTLQYYEEPDAVKAGFGHMLTPQEWTAVSSVKDHYQDLLFSVPSVAANVAHPMLQELLAELRTPGRKFAFLCGHDSNIGSVLSALGVEPYAAPAAIETKTPIGGKILFEKFRGRDGKLYADIWLVYASAEQLRAVTLLAPENPPMALPLHLTGLTPNADGLYLFNDLERRFAETIDLYETF